MTITTAVPQPPLGATGFIPATEPEILVGVKADLQTAFGGDLNFTTTNGAVTNPTPQAQLASTEAAVIGNTQALFCALANGIDPAYANGRMQDAIGRINQIAPRIPATSTIAQVTCTGGGNGVAVNIPVNALLVAEDGNFYSCNEPGVISAGGGSIVLPFGCIAQGPIPCPPQPFTIYQALQGWDTAISSTDGALGNLVETRAEFEARRQGSVALNSVGMLPSIRGALLNDVPGVLDAYTDQNNNGYPLVRNPVAQAVGGISGTTLTISTTNFGSLTTTGF